MEFEKFQSQHHCRQHDPVKGKNNKSVPLQELQQKFNGEVTGNYGCQKSQNMGQGEKCYGAAAFEQLEAMIKTGPENNGG